MKLLVIGATGLLGTGIVPEAANRGHQVAALCRHPEQVPPHANVTAVKCDIFDVDALTEAARGNDVVIHSYSPRRDHTENRIEPHKQATRCIIAATKNAGIRRLLAVGGAGTLLLPDGTKAMDTPDFPPEYMESARSTAEVLYILQKEPDLEWTFLCPSLFFAECGRTGRFRLGTDHILFGPTGKSEISIEDYAIAMIDEMEMPRHTGRRFTVGY